MQLMVDSEMVYLQLQYVLKWLDYVLQKRNWKVELMTQCHQCSGKAEARKNVVNFNTIPYYDHFEHIIIHCLNNASILSMLAVTL